MGGAYYLYPETPFSLLHPICLVSRGINYSSSPPRPCKGPHLRPLTHAAVRLTLSGLSTTAFSSPSLSGTISYPVFLTYISMRTGCSGCLTCIKRFCHP